MHPLVFFFLLLGASGSSSGGGSARETEVEVFTSEVEDDDETEDTGGTSGDDLPDTPPPPSDPVEPDVPEDPDPTENDGSGGMDHGGHDMPAVAPPGTGASLAEIATYLDQLFALGDSHSHSDDASKASEHMVAMYLVPRDGSSHVAIGDGDWFDPATWAGGEVPGDDATVLIPEGVTVTYGDISDARLFTVRVDGTLDFDTDTSSQIVFDTFVVSPAGHLIIGTAADPVDPNVDIDLIVANNGPIDTDWDPLLVSRGLISHGETTIHGAVKDSHEKVDLDPMSGDTSISFAEVPTGWQVGDTIVIAGTHYDGYKWDNDIRDVRLYPSEDEIRVITKIDANGTVHFEEPLVYDHDTPRDDLFTSVANYTRNVSIETENAEEAEVYERGHLMFMHSDDVDVRYLEVHELGRTDKSESSVPQGDQDNEFDTNVQGRYSLHLHRTGTENLDDPAIVVGTSVYGSPGWGYVHHDSNAIFENNASFDTFGAGYVAETGNETGAWTDNIAILAEGISWDAPKNTTDISSTEFDTARGGDGFWFQGRMVSSTDNVAASVNTGFVYFHRNGDDRMIDFDADDFAFADALYGKTDVSPDDAPILVFDGNETFAAKEGLHIVKANPNQGHDVWSNLDDFTAWSVKSGAHLEYTSHYILTDFDIIAKDPVAFSNPGSGISFGNNTTEIVIQDATIEGFETGIDLRKHFTSDDQPEQHAYVVIDPTFINVAQDYLNYDSTLDTLITRDDLPGLEPDLQLDPLVMNGGYWAIDVTGTKSDTLGEADFPGGTDDFMVFRPEAVRMLETNGYWTTSSGEPYMLLDIYFTDRVTGEVFYETHPVLFEADLADSIKRSMNENIEHNGTQDFEMKNGVLHAGDTPLDTAIAVPLPETPTVPDSMHVMSAGMVDEAHLSSHPVMMTEEMWVDGYLGDDTLTLDIEAGLFVNTGEMANTDLTATGGTAVLATGGAEFTVSSGRTLAVFEAAAKVGFDGDDGGMAILDLHEGGTLAYSAESGDLGTIEEIRSGAFGDTPDVLSGIDLGGATLEIDLAGLSAEAGTEFTLMSADEIAGALGETLVGGLGSRDATIVVDYLNDSVTLQLAAGSGLVTVETIGEEADVTSGAEALWQALTADQGLAEDQALPDEEDLLEVA